MSAGSKTPVSILNEYLIRRGYVPKFDLVVNGSGTHNPTFAYVVQFMDHSVLGKGRSKQEAKHEAAKKMLDFLNISCEEEYKEDMKSLVVPHENSVGYNAVGDLTDYCRKNCYPDATFVEVSECGPPHAKVFTIKCSVSHLSTIGEARTKKQAKLIAAHKMVMQLQTEAGEKPMAVAVPKKKVTPEGVNNLILPKPAPVYQPQARLYKDFCNAYIGIQEKSETVKQMLTDPDIVQLKNSCQYVKNISEELAIDILVQEINKEGDLCELPASVMDGATEEEEETVTIASLNLDEENTKKKTVFVSLQLNPPIVGAGISVSEASFDLLEYLKILCI